MLVKEATTQALLHTQFTDAGEVVEGRRFRDTQVRLAAAHFEGAFAGVGPSVSPNDREICLQFAAFADRLSL